jgi:ABC-type transport system involved in multi-copper enzyme maturation permease subunit
MELKNPILHRELRQGLLGRQMFVTQWLFVTVMALVVWMAWPRTPKFQAHQLQMSEQLFSLFWGGLYFTVSVCAAALSAVAITREKETGCFDLLCTTGLSPSRLLMGKFLSVVGFLLMLVISSIPISATCYLLGGLNWLHLLVEYLDLVAAVFLYGGIGLACSSLMERNHRALSLAFVITLPLAAWSISSQEAKHWIEVIGLMILIVRAQTIVERVRRPREEHLPPITTGESIEITVDTDSVMDRILVPHRAHKPFADDKNPVYEREWAEESGAEGRTWWHFLLRFNIGLAVLMTIFLLFARAWLQDYAQHYAPGQYETLLTHYADLAQLWFFGYLIVVSVLLGPAQSANIISKERERQTFDLLVTTLLRPHEIVLGKWRLSLRSSFHLLVLLVLPLLPVLVLIFFGKTSSLSIGGMILVAAYGLVVVAATLVTLNTLGVFCSLVCRTGAHALSVAYTIAIGWFVGPFALYYVLTRFSELPSMTYAWTTYASPFLSFFAISGSKFFDKVVQFDQPLVLTLGYLGLTALVNLLLLAVMVAKFDRFWKRA